MKRVLLSLLVVAMLGAATTTAQAAPWNRRPLGHAPQPYYGHYGPPAPYRGPAAAFRHHDPHCFPHRHHGFYAPYQFGYYGPGFSLSFGRY